MEQIIPDGIKVIESCVESYDEAITACKMGANRIELCSALNYGGLTPERNLIQKAHNSLGTRLKVMIRPRPGGFVYNEPERAQIKSDIDFCRTLGIEEIVTGAIRNQQLDTELIKELILYARPMNITIHKAIDETENPLNEIERIKSLNYKISILTSGKKKTAIEGAEQIKKMAKAAGNDITIIAAGNINYSNLSLIHRLIGIQEYHGRNIVRMT